MSCPKFTALIWSWFMLVNAIGVFFEARMATTCTFCNSTFFNESIGISAKSLAAFSSAAAFIAMNAVNPKRIFFIPFYFLKC